ncbi:hypothetical protein CC1G_15407 [Coprinopsis cinerea okayama7|uniref:Uncharacterized protein n=1 Tax=Coprinopsis cinerea (strain Okayama-7 / 130 / ATCC MYA-4618 / FGSC 9003) TaxID=240176 RepID=D6RQM2_COPC7|nr:hypothetical protein CC1G_15407 [Coprinopsis cinerea okayama7\|eukprot:XP_002910129.1 hypothetical protein CC1G_15407 [Coprinopsis cinerea okayama7\
MPQCSAQCDPNLSSMTRSSVRASGRGWSGSLARLNREENGRDARVLTSYEGFEGAGLVSTDSRGEIEAPGIQRRTLEAACLAAPRHTNMSRALNPGVARTGGRPQAQRNALETLLDRGRTAGLTDAAALPDFRQRRTFQLSGILSGWPFALGGMKEGRKVFGIAFPGPERVDEVTDGPGRGFEPGFQANDRSAWAVGNAFLSAHSFDVRGHPWSK